MTSHCPVADDWARQVRERADAGESRTPNERLPQELFIGCPGRLRTDEIVQIQADDHGGTVQTQRARRRSGP